MDILFVQDMDIKTQIDERHIYIYIYIDEKYTSIDVCTQQKYVNIFISSIFKNVLLVLNKLKVKVMTNFLIFFLYILVCYWNP